MKKKKYLIFILVTAIILTGALVMVFIGDKDDKSLTANDAKNWEYTINGFTGEILQKTENDHGHSH